MYLKLLRILSLLFIFIGALILSERPLYAYADPGTGLLALQAAGSALVAAGWYLRRKIYGFFHRAEPSTENRDEDASFRDREDSRPS